MSYPAIKTRDDVADLLRRKEFYSLKPNAHHNIIDVDGLMGKFLSPQSYQLFVRNFMNPNTPNRSVHVGFATGTGKCHAADTPILMYDGTTKMVQDLLCGDRIMGDDSTPRTILSLARGREQMVQIAPEEPYEPFTCNRSHILSLMRLDQRVIDISCDEWLAYTKRPLYLYSRPVRFAHWSVGARMDALKRMAHSFHHLTDRRIAFIWYVSPSSNIGKYIIYICKTLAFQTILPFKQCIMGEYDIDARATLIKFTARILAEDVYYGFSLDGNRRYYMGNMIVTHNTLAGCLSAHEFVQAYRPIYAIESSKYQLHKNYTELDRNTPSVYVLGFGATKTAFVRELLRYPEFGFITVEEKKELARRQELAQSGLADDVRSVKEYWVHLKRSITNKSKGGFFKFYGYDEFVNRLFAMNRIKPVDLEAIVRQRGATITLEDIFAEYIREGKIGVNQQFLRSFENSLIIADEVHNTYNTNMKNNRGIAIQYVLDRVASCRFMDITATPFNNSPTEIVELINYHTPGIRVSKRELFLNSRTLKEGALERIVELMRGKWTFVQDTNLRYFPKRIFVGETIRVPHDVGNLSKDDVIPYLKFIPCPMSKFHQNTLMELAKARMQTTSSPTDEETDEEIYTIASADNRVYTIPIDGVTIFDIAFPNPDSDEVGLYRSADVRASIGVADQAWRDKKAINLKRAPNGSMIVTGAFLHVDRVGEYSTKFERLIRDILDIIKSFAGNPAASGKIILYHERVHGSGVLLEQELLIENGFIDETSEPTDGTICGLCAITLAKHKNAGHKYYPARFIMVHSEIEKSVVEQYIDMYNAPDNAHGLKYLLFVGSRIIRESLDFKCVRYQFLLVVSVSIPMMLQVIGRTVRKGAHDLLPPEMRQVFLRIYVSTINEELPYMDTISPELYRYIDKLLDYQVIQSIEGALNSDSLDADINRDIIMSPDMLNQYFPDGRDQPPKALLGNLYYEPVVRMPIMQLPDLNLSTFHAYQRSDEEIATIAFTIKRLFLLQPIWRYDDLWKTVRAPPFSSRTNPALFEEGNFSIALHKLVGSVTPIIRTSRRTTTPTEMDVIEKLRNVAETLIYDMRTGYNYKIEHIGEFYIRFPVTTTANNPLNTVHADHLEHSRNRHFMMIKEFEDTAGRPIVDVETYLRVPPKSVDARIDVASFMQNTRANVSYNERRHLVLEKYLHANPFGFLTEYGEDFQTAFLEEAIIIALGHRTGEHSATYDIIIELLTRLDVIIYVREVKKYADVLKQYGDRLSDMPDDAPIGYMHARYVKLYHIESAAWFEINKTAMKRHIKYKENETIVGYFEYEAATTKFKLRKPVHAIRQSLTRMVNRRQSSADVRSEAGSRVARTQVADARLIEHGIVCGTKNKADLLRILEALGAKTTALEGRQIRIRNLCRMILETLITNEIGERSRNGRQKWLYGFWDELPQIVL